MLLASSITDRLVPRIQRALGPLLLVTALCTAAWEMRAVVPQIDDAYISYRYALNLILRMQEIPRAWRKKTLTLQR
jgi:hypothetical protein